MLKLFKGIRRKPLILLSKTTPSNKAKISKETKTVSAQSITQVKNQEEVH
jgi:hypothetical protein